MCHDLKRDVCFFALLIVSILFVVAMHGTDALSVDEAGTAPEQRSVSEESAERSVAVKSVSDEEAIAAGQNNPYSEIAKTITQEEKELIARVVYRESGGESMDGQIAVAEVILNRFLHEAYSGSISDIVYAPNQFAVGNTYTDAQLEAVEAALAGDDILDLNTDVVYFSTGSLTYGSYYKTIGGHVFRTYH